MIIKKLNLRNIRSYEELELKFPKGSVLLSGEIGAGKTSILLGLQFALFGLQPGQKGASILRQGTDNAYARLEMEVDEEKIILERTIKKSKSGGITQDSNTIYYGDKKEELSTSEMKDRVINLLNYPKEFVKKSNLLYKFTVYTPQEEMKAIIQEKPETRLDTLRHIFGIDRYKRIKDNVQILSQKIKEKIKINEVLIGELNLIKEKLTLENEKKILLAKETNNLRIESKTIAERKQIAEEELDSIREIIEEERKTLSEISKTELMLRAKRDSESRMNRDLMLSKNQIKEPVEFSEERFRAVLQLFEKHKKILEEKNSEFLEVNSKISVINSRKEVPLKLRDKIMSLENCPTCFQNVHEEHKNKISKRTTFDIEELDRDFEQRIKEKSSLIKDIEKEKELIGGYEFDKNKLQQDKIKFEHQKSIEIKIKSDIFVLERTSNEIIELQKNLENLKEKNKTFEKSSEIFKKNKEGYERISSILRTKEITLATKEKELELIRLRLEELREEIEKKKKINKETIYLKGLHEWIRGEFISLINLTEKNVMVKLRGEFSSIFGEWFSMLVSDNLSVRLDEDFTPIITNNDYEIEYDFLSGGERTAVALAYRLSLNQVLNSMLSQIKTKDLVILDEPTDGFATEQIDKMRDIFEQLKAEQIILVSHEQKIEGFVDHVKRIRKDETSLVEE